MEPTPANSADADVDANANANANAAADTTAIIPTAPTGSGATSGASGATPPLPPPMLAIPPAPLAPTAAATPLSRRDARNARNARIGSGVGAFGGLGALIGFFVPWFVFVVAVANCHAPFQVELYDVVGAALALNTAGTAPMALAVVALCCALVILIVGLMALRRPTTRRARLQLLLALTGVGALLILGAAANNGEVIPVSYSYIHYLGIAPTFWLPIAALLLVWVGAAVAHAATRPQLPSPPYLPSPLRLPRAEGALAALGVVGLLASGAAALTVRPAPYPALTCASQAPQTPLPPGDQAAYLTSAQGAYALDAATGRALWRCGNPLGGVVTAGPPTLAAGALIAASRDGYVYAIRPSDGDILWRADVGGRGRFVTQQPPIAPIAGQGAIYGVNGADQVYALRAGDGALLWRRQDTAALLWPGSPLLLARGALVYFANVDSAARLVALDLQSGRLLWRSLDRALITYTPGRYLPGAQPLRGDGATIYAEEIDGQTLQAALTARSVADGTLRWRYALPGQPGEAPALSAFTLVDGVVYLEARTPMPLPGSAPANSNTPGVGANAPPNAPTPTNPNALDVGAPRVVALRAADGAQLWSAAAPDGASSQPIQYLNIYVAIASDGVGVYVAVSWGQSGAGDTVYAFDARQGALRWRYDLSQPAAGLALLGPQFALAPDAIYLLDSFNTVIALDAHTGGARWRQRFSTANGLNYDLSALNLAAPGASGAATSGPLYATGASLTTLNPADGTTHWRFTPDAATTPYTEGFGPASPPLAPPIFAP